MNIKNQLNTDRIDGWIKKKRSVIQIADAQAAPNPNILIPPFVPAGTGFQGNRRRYGVEEMIPTSLPQVSAQHSV